MADYGKRGVTGLSYRTGAMMFYALFRTMGPKAFDRGLADWFTSYRTTGSTTGQFVATMQEASSADLSALFDEWLYSGEWSRKIAAGASVEEVLADY